MRNHVLIIEDSRSDYFRLKSWLEENGFNVLPSSFKQMAMAMDRDSDYEGDIEDYVIDVIKNNYDNIGLILCDISYENRDKHQGGNRVVRAIRNYKELNPIYWSFMVPIFAVTNFADKREGIMKAGADFALLKDEFDDNPESPVRSMIETQIIEFEKHITETNPEKIADHIRKIGFKRSRRDYWEIKDKKTAFIMSSFQPKHLRYAQSITKILEEYNIDGIIANKQGGEFNHFLLKNIETCLTECDFGICIFADDSKNKDKTAKIKRSIINPNVCIELGYLLALNKPFCILKEEKLTDLPSDLSGEIYVQFNGYTLKRVLIQWLETKKIITPSKKE